jgi:aminoglycoside phosphotransferase (APT) family kinase protein
MPVTDRAPAGGLTRADIAAALPYLPFPGASPGDLVCTELPRPIVGGTAGLWRVSAAGQSVLVKLLRCARDGDIRWRPGRSADHWYYWRREALAYQSGLLTRLPRSLRAPRPYVVRARDDEAVAIWMEYVPGTLLESGDDPAVYRRIAFSLGEAQASYARDVPGAAWLSRHWLREYLHLRDGEGHPLGDRQAWQALAASGGPCLDRAGEFQELWDRRYEHTAAVEAQPPTLCHLDMHLKNVLVARDGGLVLVDWSFAGIGGLAQDAGNLHPDCVLDFHAKASDLWPMFELVAREYHAGLRAGGLDVDGAAIRRAMAAATVAKYAWIVPAMLTIAASGRPTLNGRPTGAAMPTWSQVAEFLLDLQRDVLR